MDVDQKAPHCWSRPANRLQQQVTGPAAAPGQLWAPYWGSKPVTERGSASLDQSQRSAGTKQGVGNKAERGERNVRKEPEAVAQAVGSMDRNGVALHALRS